MKGREEEEGKRERWKGREEEGRTGRSHQQCNVILVNEPQRRDRHVRRRSIREVVDPEVLLPLVDTVSSVVGVSGVRRAVKRGRRSVRDIPPIVRRQEVRLKLVEHDPPRYSFAREEPNLFVPSSLTCSFERQRDV
jgi:hypothetical protein